MKSLLRNSPQPSACIIHRDMWRWRLSKRKKGFPQVIPSVFPSGYPKVAPQSAKTDSLHKSYPRLQGCFLCKLGSASWVGLTPQTPEVRLTPPAQLVSATSYFCHNGLDGRIADVASFRLLGSVRDRASAKFRLDIYQVVNLAPHSTWTHLGEKLCETQSLLAPCYDFQDLDSQGIYIIPQWDIINEVSGSCKV